MLRYIYHLDRIRVEPGSADEAVVVATSVEEALALVKDEDETFEEEPEVDLVGIAVEGVEVGILTVSFDENVG